MGLWETVWKSIILGTAQGLTEFLPVSSSGHLVFLQKILGYNLEGGGMTFINIMLHFGTLLAVIFVFRKDILALFHKPFRMLIMLIVATVPAAVVGLVFNDKIDEAFSGPKGLGFLSVCFAVTAAILLATEIIAKRQKTHRQFGWGNTVAMGLMQAVALFPGISRSGSTIAAGTATQAKSEDVTKFSFLMSIPVILGSVVVSLKGVIFDEPETVSAMGPYGVVGIVIGIVFSALAGFFAIKVMLKVIGKANYKWFSVYLIALSLTCLFLDVSGILPSAM